MNSKIKLALAAASAAGAAVTMIGQASVALAGPSLTGITNQTYNAGASYNLQAGQSFSITGQISGFTPFQASTGLLPGTTAGSISSPAFAVGITEGNAGTSTLTAAFDRNGFGGTTTTASTLATPSFAVQGAVIALGGTGGTGGITTITSTNQFNTPKGIVLNQDDASGVPSITVTAASSPTAITGVNINSQLIGASAVNGSFSDTFQVINSLSAFQ